MAQSMASLTSYEKKSQTSDFCAQRILAYEVGMKSQHPAPPADVYSFLFPTVYLPRRKKVHCPARKVIAAPSIAGIAGGPVLYRDGVEVQLHRFPDRAVVFHIRQTADAQQRMAHRRTAEQSGIVLYSIDCYYVSVSQFHSSIRYV